MAMNGTWRELRGLRADPPGYAKSGGRRSTFQASLEQSEQFMAAAAGADYATRPVQLFYGLSQAGRALIAASPRIGNQAWDVHGHGMSVVPSGPLAADATVKAASSGLFVSVAQALGVDAPAPEEPITVAELWPLILYSAFMPLTTDAPFPLMLFTPYGGTQATLSWAPEHIGSECAGDVLGESRLKVLAYLKRYPSLQGVQLTGNYNDPPPVSKSDGPGYQINIEFPQEPATGDSAGLGARMAFQIEDRDFFVVTPTVGSMTTPLHPLLAWWGVLLALSSLARYEPARWSKMIDVDSSFEANAIESLLDRAVDAVPALVGYLMTTLA